MRAELYPFCRANERNESTEVALLGDPAAYRDFAADILGAQVTAIYGSFKTCHTVHKIYLRFNGRSCPNFLLTYIYLVLNKLCNREMQCNADYEPHYCGGEAHRHSRAVHLLTGFGGFGGEAYCIIGNYHTYIGKR